MRELILKMSISIDGFVGSADGGLDWIFKTMDPDAIAWTVAAIEGAGVHAMGSRTFRDMAAYWPTSTEPFAPAMNDIPKVVFSRTGDLGDPTNALRDASRARDAEGRPHAKPSAEILASWTAPRILRKDLADEIATLKREPGKPIVAHGGARFAQSLVRLGLVDELRLLVHPVALGRGLPLFSELAAPLMFERIETRAFAGGAVAQVLRPR
jgi:dihydrofolate reductase